MGKSTGFAQSVYGLIQFMGKGTKHPHKLYMYWHMRTNTHSTLHLCLWISLSSLPRCMRWTVFFGQCCLNQHWCCLCVCACRYHQCLQSPTHPHRSHERGSSVCQHGASLTFWVLLKVLMEEILRGLCPLEPSCASVSSPQPILSSFSLCVSVLAVGWGMGGGTLG